jgi:hypothetical protein
LVICLIISLEMAPGFFAKTSNFFEKSMPFLRTLLPIGVEAFKTFTGNKLGPLPDMVGNGISGAFDAFDNMKQLQYSQPKRGPASMFRASLKQ